MPNRVELNVAPNMSVTRVEVRGTVASHRT